MDRRGGGIIIAFDSGCGPCSKFKAAVEFLDARRLVGFLDIEDAERAGLLDGVPRGLRFASFHIVTEQDAAGTRCVASGSGAILPLVRVLSPSASRLAGRVPVVEAALRFGYSTLSRLHRGCPASQGRARRGAR